MAVPELSVITITYNERENIRLFITTVNRIFQEHKLQGEIVVVDDNSPDGTSQVVQELQKEYPLTTLITRPGKLGIGSAYLTGFQAAKGKVVAFLDADLSHPPEYLPEFYALAANNTVVFGSRYLGRTLFETDFAHRIGTKVLNTWVSVLLRTGMKDHTNGYVVIKREILNQILNYSQAQNVPPFDHILYGITIAAVAQKLGIPVVEKKAPYNQRQYGETKIPFWWGIKVVFGDIWYSLKLWSRLRT